MCDPIGSNLSGSPETNFLNHSRHDLATVPDVRIDRMCRATFLEPWKHGYRIIHPFDPSMPLDDPGLNCQPMMVHPQ